MDTTLPSADDVRELLTPLTLKQIEDLSKLSGVPAPTIYKIRRGETKNPGIETLRQFLPHIQAVLGATENQPPFRSAPDASGAVPSGAKESAGGCGEPEPAKAA